MPDCVALFQYRTCFDIVSLSFRYRMLESPACNAVPAGILMLLTSLLSACVPAVADIYAEAGFLAVAGDPAVVAIPVIAGFPAAAGVPATGICSFTGSLLC